MKYAVYSSPDPIKNENYRFRFDPSKPEDICFCDTQGKVQVDVFLFIKGMEKQCIRSAELTWTELRKEIRNRLLVASRAQKLELI
jgi:hypothetical protein